MCVIWTGVLVWGVHCFPSPEKSSFRGVFPSTCLSPYFFCFDQNCPRCLFGMYGTELLFHQWFLREAAACKSTPEDADLFYVPSLGTWLARTFEICCFPLFLPSSGFKRHSLRAHLYCDCLLVLYLYCTYPFLSPHARLYGYTSASSSAWHLLMTKLQVLFQMRWSAQLFRSF